MRPAINLSKVDFPEPLSPAIPSQFPEETEKVMLLRIERPSTEKFRLVASNWVITLTGANDAVVTNI